MADKKDKKEEEEAPEIGQMKRGDYMIHVFIEKARQIKVPEGNTVDPIIEISVLNEKKFTTSKDDIGATGVCTWNEHLFFEPKNLSQEQIEGAKINIKLLDKGYFKDAVIGCYEFDVAYIYFMKDHSLQHKWLALSNPASENFNEVAAYLKVSISVSTRGDKQIQITDDTSNANDDSVMMPPSIRPTYYQVKFRFFRAENLPAMDRSVLSKTGSIDAYIQCQYLNNNLKTSVITAKEGIAVMWKQEFWIPCQLPIMSSRIVMKLYDEDKIKDEIVGSLLFNLKECINERNGKFFWKNIYGAPLGCSGDNTDNMNSNPDLASTWKGRILMQVTAEKTDKPTCLLKNLTDPDVELAARYMNPHEFEIIAEIGQGICLPDNDKFTVMVKIADFTIKTDKPTSAENTYNRWGYRSKQQTYVAPYQDIYDIGKVYVYLMQGDKPICYFKEDIEKFMDPNPSWQWIEMLPDLAIGKVSDPSKAGFISLKLSIHDKTNDGPINFEQFNAWKKPPQKRLNLFKVRAYIFQCRDLPSADKDGQSDPFIKVWDCTKETKKTRTIMDNNNPLFYECLELEIEATKLEEMPPFILDIYDYDTIGNDFICRSIIRLEDAVFCRDDTIPEPKWHPCRLKPSAPPCGEVLICFSIVEDDYNYKTPLNYLKLKESVVFKENQIDINILGLRDLQSAGIFPVKKAFIVFNLKSLVPPEDGIALDNIRTQPSAAGSNPTINTMISFNIPLPQNRLFCPRLSCTVHDYIFKGLAQPLIGAFTIPIGDLLQDLIEERERETEAIDRILEDLDRIMKNEGVPTYSNLNKSIQESQSYEERSGMIFENIRKSIKIHDEMKKPLLIDIEEEEISEAPSVATPKRVTPQSLAVKSPGTQKNGSVLSGPTTTRNALKTPIVNKFGLGNKTQMLKDSKAQEEKQQRQIEDERRRKQEELKTQGIGGENILMPKYQYDKKLQVFRESGMPPDSLYLGLGWDENHEAQTRHYRKYYPNELENVKDIMPVPSPFQTYEIKRGQSRGASKSIWPFGGNKTDESGEVTDEQVVGRFKGIVTVQSQEDKKEYADKKADLVHDLKTKLNQLSLKKTGAVIDFSLEKMDTFEGRQQFDLQLDKLGVGHLGITRKLADLESDETLKRLLMVQTKCIVRVYMISAYNLSSRDNGSDSDPYLVLTVGNKVYNERDNYQLDNPNPDFYKSYDFQASFPGCAPLVINVMDYDDIFGDDSIGITTVDLEDRFFSPEWQSIENKPIEFRNIYHPSSSISQGVVKMWVEIHPTEVKLSEIPIFNIAPKPAEEFEVRVVVFDTTNVIAMDVEGTSDVYCRAFFDSREETKETDTHYRCQNGKASWNYRMLFNIKHPRKDYQLSLQLYDRDFFKSNDIIGEMSIDLKNAIQDCALTGRPLSLNKKYYNDYMKDKYDFKFKDDNTFYVSIKGQDDKGKIKETGKLRVQIDIYPKAIAEKNKVGEARQEPNHSPFLSPPVGRLQFSLNPLKMFNQLIGPSLRRKIYCAVCCVICFMICASLFFLVMGNLNKMKSIYIILAILFVGAIADEADDRFSHALFIYPTGKYESLNQDLRTFLETELGNYKEIIVEERDGIHQAQLMFMDKVSGEPGETVFPNYFPIKMLKDMLKQNGFIKQKQEEL